jgi:serine/threonine protein kinase
MSIPSPVLDSSTSRFPSAKFDSGEWRYRTLTSGTVFEGYHIERPIGRGAMGVVYAAREIQNNRPVAIKILGGALQSQNLFSRFSREAATVARLKHPGIVELYQVGQNTQHCYLAMQLVNGMTLRDWIQFIPQISPDDLQLGFRSTTMESKLSPSVQTVQFTDREIRFDSSPKEVEIDADPREFKILADNRYIRRIAVILHEASEALVHAHDAGVTHRDLKPENMMIDSEGRVVIIDFGLARSFADTTITTHSALIGTPAYMAPEQLQGQLAGPQSDIYALGLIGYELLTRTIPFRAKFLEALMGEILHKPIPPLAGRNPSVPRELANIIHRATAKRPAERYATAQELRDDLERFLNGKRVTACAYRFRFNQTEVGIERPRRVSLTSYLNFGLCSFMILTSVVLIPKGINSPLIISCVAGVYATATYLFFAGTRHARQGAWAIVLSSVSIAGYIVYSLKGADKSNVELVFLMLLMAAIFLGIGFLHVGVLLSHTTRDWLKKATQKRTEFEQERSGTRTTRSVQQGA